MAIYYREEQVRQGEGMLGDLLQRKKPPTVKKYLRDQRGLIRAVLKKGFGYEDIARGFQDLNISLDAKTLAAFYVTRKKAAKSQRKSETEEAASILHQELTPEQVSQLTEKLEALKVKRNGLTYVEVIEWHFESITAALDNDWSAADIMAKFAAGGLELKCTESSFLQGVKQVKRQRREAEPQDGALLQPAQPSLSTDDDAATLEDRLVMPSSMQRNTIAESFNL